MMSLKTFARLSKASVMSLGNAIQSVMNQAMANLAVMCKITQE